MHFTEKIGKPDPVQVTTSHLTKGHLVVPLGTNTRRGLYLAAAMRAVSMALISENIMTTYLILC